MNKNSVVVIAIFYLLLSVRPTVAQRYYERTLNFSTDSIYGPGMQATCRTADGGLVIAGNILVDNLYQELLIKLSAEGMLEWSYLLTAPIQKITALSVDSDQNIICSGAIAYFQQNISFFFAAKFSSMGALIWSRAYDISCKSTAQLILPDGQYLFYCSTALIALDPDGSWRKATSFYQRYGSSYYSGEARSIQLLQDSTLLLVAKDQVIQLLQVTVSGKPLRARQFFDSTFMLIPSSVVQLHSGQILVGASVIDQQSFTRPSLLMQYLNPDLSLQKNIQVTIGPQIYLQQVMQAPGGDIAATASLWELNGSWDPATVLQFDSLGSFRKAVTISAGKGFYFWLTISAESNSDYRLAGMYFVDDGVFGFLKIDSQLNGCSTKSIAGLASPFSCRERSADTIVALPLLPIPIDLTIGLTPLVLQKAAMPCQIKDEVPTVEQMVSPMLQIFPNPVSSSHRISLAVTPPLNGSFILSVRSVTGQQVYCQPLHLDANTTPVMLPQNELAAGFYKIELLDPTTFTVIYRTSVIFQ